MLKPLNIKVKVPSYDIPATFLFAHASRIADAWTPMPEIVWLPSRQVSEGNISISIRSGNTRELGIPFRSKNLKRIINHRKTLQLGTKLVFDARFQTDKNIAHQFNAVVGPVLLARRELSVALGYETEITVILRDGAAGYSQAIYRYLGIPLLTTDAQVEAQLVQVDDQCVSTHQNGRMISAGGSKAIIALTPEVVTRAKLLLSDPGNMPEKIFISRRGSRSLINDSEITRILAERGFQKFYFEDEPYERQILLCRHAKVIVAIHGAAMSYISLNRNGLCKPMGDLSGLRIIELFGPGYSVDHYRRDASVLNAHWCGVRGQITADVIRDLDEHNMPRRHQATSFRIDPLSLEMALEYSENGSKMPPIHNIYK